MSGVGSLSIRMPRWYHLAATFFLLQAIQAFNIFDRLVYGEWPGKPGDKITEGLNLLLIATSVVLCGTGFRRIRSMRTSAILGLGLAGFLLCSALWSVEPDASLRQGLVYLFVVFGAIGIVGNLEGDEFMDLLARVCLFAGVVSLVLLVLSPGNSRTSDGDFRGIFGHKNLLGQAMTMGVLASLHALRSGKRGKLRSALSLSLMTIVALASSSVTSCITIFFFYTVFIMEAFLRRQGIVRVITVVLMISLTPLLLLAVAHPDSLLEMIGKDPTLTGRTDIWSDVIPYIYQKPWLGWGYDAFWSPDNPAAVEIGDSLHWFAPEAHNGLLEMLLSVGVIGTAFLIFMLARNIGLGLRSLRTSEKALAVSSLLCCAGIILVGISETVLLAGLEASTAVFFVTGFYCERALWLRQRHSAAARHPINRYALHRQAAST